MDKEIYINALGMFLHRIQNLKTYPEDHWENLSDDWDINFWRQGLCFGATIYPVVDGNTITSNGAGKTLAVIAEFAAFSQ